MLRILGRPTSINVRKVLWTADEIGLAYAHEPQWATPAAPSGSPELLALNPNGMVPVIVDEAGPLWESNTICRYLAARHDRPDLLPAEPRARAAVELWMDWQATELNTAWRYAFLALIRKEPGFDDQGQVERSFTTCAARLALIAGQLDRTRGYMAGDGFTLADINIALSVHRIRSLPGAPPFPSRGGGVHGPSSRAPRLRRPLRAGLSLSSCSVLTRPVRWGNASPAPAAQRPGRQVQCVRPLREPRPRGL